MNDAAQDVAGGRDAGRGGGRAGRRRTGACISASRELRKDGGGGGGGVARRARTARASKAKSGAESCATSCGTSPGTSCAASFTCPSFTSPKGSLGGGMRVMGVGSAA